MEGVWCVYGNDLYDYAKLIFKTKEDGERYLEDAKDLRFPEVLMFWSFEDDFYEAVAKHEAVHGAYSKTKE